MYHLRMFSLISFLTLLVATLAQHGTYWPLPPSDYFIINAVSCVGIHQHSRNSGYLLIFNLPFDKLLLSTVYYAWNLKLNISYKVVLLIYNNSGEYIVNLEHKLGASDWSHRATLVLSMIKQSSVPAHNTPQYIPVSAQWSPLLPTWTSFIISWAF